MDLIEVLKINLSKFQLQHEADKDTMKFYKSIIMSILPYASDPWLPTK